MPRNYRRGRGLQRARAPYNFVPEVTQEPNDQESMRVYDPMPAQNGLPAHNVFDDNLKSGYFTVHVKTKTPLFIRGMLTRAESKQNEKQRKAGKETNQSEDFFSHDGKTPVIPGSSLKGMLRSLIEIISFSKMHFVSDSPKIFFRAVAAQRDDPQGTAYKKIMGNLQQYIHAGSNIEAGFLMKRKGKWYVHPAESFGEFPFALVADKPDVVGDVEGIKHLNQGNYQINQFPVAYAMGRHNKASHVYTPNNPDDATAVLVCTGNMAETQSSNQRIRTNRKKFVLVKTERGKRPRPINETAIRDYLDGLSGFQTGKNDQSEKFFDNKNGLLKQGRVVFYIEEEGEVIRFGHTPNFRIAHLIKTKEGSRATTPRDLVPPELLNSHLIDYADAMFGYVSDSNEEQRTPKAYAGRVSVTSAMPNNNNYVAHNQAITPRILGSPKPTTFQHYLEQPTQATNDKSRLHHFGTQGAVIRGHKQYWRQNIRGISDIEAHPSDIKDKEKVTTKIKPLTEGEFTFTVHFTNLTHSELGALAWALTLGDDPNAYHMLGMGKPYGMGVVKLTPQLTIVDRSKRYSQLFSDSGKWFTGESIENIDTYIQAFKDEVRNHTRIAFDDHWRIQQLKAMLRLQSKNQEFDYMELEQFKDRPVLPYPDEIDRSNG